MLSPSTAPRWKRHTKTGRSDGPTAGRPEANAARVRNNGSSPRLTSARPLDLTNTRREIVIVSGTPDRRGPDPPPACVPAQGPSRRQAARESRTVYEATSYRRGRAYSPRPPEPRGPQSPERSRRDSRWHLAGDRRR